MVDRKREADDATCDETRIVVRRLVDIGTPPAALCAMAEIFFASSATRSFASPEARVAFRERWLGRHLVHYPDLTLVALDPSGEVIGYLVGATDDPALSPLFADITYFQQLADLTPVYPAHLHINLASEARGRGIGGRLIETFCATLEARRIAGVHVVTGAASRNLTFYTRQGFEPLRTIGGAVMLGRRLRPVAGDIGRSR